MIDFWFEFVPMLVMMLALFGFMDLLIIWKWLTDWSVTPEKLSNSPSIITAMITMCIQVGTPAPGSSEEAVIGTWATQSFLMKTMMLLVVLSAPTMLLAKPIILGCCQKPHVHEEKHDDDFVAANKEAEGQEVDFDVHTLVKQATADTYFEESSDHGFGDMFIH